MPDIAVMHLAAKNVSQILVSVSDAVTAANATRNAVIRSWSMAAD
jgi:hypothetical protein